MNHKTAIAAAIAADHSYSSAASMTAGIESATQHAMDTIQSHQENAVNAGHRPDVAVTFILRMERHRDSINRAARSFINTIQREYTAADKKADQLRQRGTCTDERID